MTAEFGHLLLCLALGVALVQSVLPLWGAHRGNPVLMAVAGPAAVMQAALLTGAFGLLMLAFINSDFSVALVSAHSHSAKPMLYKVSGTWGNHEGSMLLWVMVMAIFGAMIAWRGANLPDSLKSRILAVQGALGVAFLCFIIFTSNPFLRLDPAPIDGNDLNPLLQDPGLAFHPPFLYLGYVGLSTTFSFAVAALIEGRVDPAWARWVRPWTLLAWCFLTVGIALGSYWAYYELGWGGWWFWDPVENASFMPWLVATALLHSAIVVEKRSALKSWTILLAILAFSLSLIGTFIVRSGIITSVHAFAEDPTRGVFILGMLVVAVGGALALFAWRAPQLQAEGAFAPISREGALLVNNVLLTVSAGAVLLGTLFPLLLEFINGAKISVGPPFFDMAFGGLMVPLILILPIGAMLSWKRADLAGVMQRLWWVAALNALAALTIWGLNGGRWQLAMGIAFGLWLVVGAFWDVAERVRLGQIGWRDSLRRAIGLPRADWGKAVAHAGLGLTVFGIALVTALEVEDNRIVKPGESWVVGRYEFTLEAVKRERGPNYRSDRGTVTVKREGQVIQVLHPEKRFYPVQGMPTTEAAISSSLRNDVYVVLGDPQQGTAGYAIRTYIKPFVNWIWIGALVMCLGGVLSLTDRRHRVGAPRRASVAAAEVAS